MCKAIEDMVEEGRIEESVKASLREYVKESVKADLKKSLKESAGREKKDIPLRI